MSIKVKRTRTFISGLDGFLQGGLVKGSTTLIVGSPGCGKTVFCLQYIVRGAQNGQPGVYVSLEEPPDQLRFEAQTLNLGLEAQFGKTIEIVDAATLRLGLSPQGRFALSSERFTLEGLIEAIQQARDSVGATRIVIDPVTPLLTLETSTEKGVGSVAEEVVARLGGFLQRSGMTCLMTAREEEARLGYITQGIIGLEQREVPGREIVELKRYLTVRKMRGTQCPEKILQFRITGNGIVLTE